MSFLSKLELDGGSYNILECSYEFTQSIDSMGKPQGMPNPDLLNWMLDHSQTKDGKIIFFRRDAMSKLQELKFEKAYCINFKEHFNANDSQPLQIEMVLIAKTLDINGAAHQKNWR